MAKLRKGTISLALSNPELCNEWDYEKNALTPETVSKASHKNVWWKCSKGHEWQATVKNRTSGTNCPICSRVLGAKARNALFIKQRSSLACKYPELAKEWHPTKNGISTPENYLPKSNKKMWWQCSRGHEWQAAISSRANGSGCPYCSGLKTIVGENDLETTYPEIAKEWHPTKNGELAARDFSYGSRKRIWWQCTKGHEWQTPIAYRTIDKTGCPYCAKELQTSFPEQAILFYIRKCFPDAVNNDRSILEGKEIDIYIPSCKTAIEYDGEAWHKNTKKDLIKSELCQSKGVRLIRIRESGCKDLIHNADIYDCTAGDKTMLSAIIRDICKDVAKADIDVDVARDALLIQEQYVLSAKESSIAALYPELAKEWHPTKNGKLNPTMFFIGSGKRVWWICKNGHEWQAVIESRVAGRGCPYCSGRNAISGENDLATVNPNLVKEWNFLRNWDVHPSDVLPNSNKKVWWICKNGHEWQDSISHRSANRGCPYCSGRRIIIGENDLETLCPEIAKQWHPTKNGNLTPRDVSKGSNRKVWWVCNLGHEWQAQINSRTRGNGCPYCSGQRILKGFNDLATTHPFLISEWDFDNNIILPDNISSGSHTIVWWKCSKGHKWQSQVKNRVNGTNCPYCSGYKISIGETDLVSTNPKLAKEWHPSKNGNLTPRDVSKGSNRKVWWICDYGHEWQAQINSRTRGNGCPYCSRQRSIIGKNDLETTDPDLAKEWHPTKNGDLSPRDVIKGSNRKIWWVCDLGHEWQARICDRKRGNGCPYCSNKKLLAGYNDFATINPSLANEWDYIKNGNLKPDMVFPVSGKRVWWIGLCGHEWQASICDRVRGTNCPYCNKKRVLVGNNDLFTTNPELAKQWHPTKNGNLTPHDVTNGSDKKVWWKCEKGHEWNAAISSRNNGNGCPYCSDRAPKPVMCLETGLIYSSLSDAAKSCGLTKGYAISLCCKGKTKSAGGYHWKYLDQEK